MFFSLFCLILKLKSLEGPREEEGKLGKCYHLLVRCRQLTLSRGLLNSCALEVLELRCPLVNISTLVMLRGKCNVSTVMQYLSKYVYVISYYVYISQQWHR